MPIVVIEGLDGSGKSTQLNLFQNYLKSKQIIYQYIHFPRTDAPIFGDLVSRFLRGDLGKINEVNPYLVALIYAGDRNNAAPIVNEWLNTGQLVIFDRYVYSNIAYQCAKIEDIEKREELKNWILNLEYNYYNIPQPDLNLFLDVPFKFTQQRLTENREGAERHYLQGQVDIHEADLNFQDRVRNIYLNLANSETTLKLINCCENNEMLAPNIISEKIISTVNKFINL